MKSNRNPGRVVFAFSFAVRLSWVVWGCCLWTSLSDAQTLYLSYGSNTNSATLLDDSGNNHNATLYHVGVASGGPWQKYLRFNGTNSWAQIGTFTNTRPFSISMAFRTQGPLQAGSPQYLISNNRDMDPPPGGFSLEIDESMRLSGMFEYGFQGATNRTYHLVGPVLETNQWYQSIVYYDGYECGLILDGTIVASAYVPPASLYQGPYPLVLGCLGFQAPNYLRFNGDLGQVCIYTNVPTGGKFLGAQQWRQRATLIYNFDAAPYTNGGAVYFTEGKGTGLDAMLKRNATYHAGGGVSGGETQLSSSNNIADYLVIPTQSGLVDTHWSHGFAVSFWFKLDQFVAGSLQYLISCNRDASPPDGGFSINVTGDQKVSAQVQTTNGRVTIAAPPGTGTQMQAGVWYHVALSFDGSSASLYVNGSLEQQVAFNEATLVPPPYNLYAGVLAFEADGGGWGWYPMHGRMDELYVFNEMLAPDEVNALYRSHADIAGGHQFNFDDPNSAGAAGDSGTLFRPLALASGATLSANGVFGRSLHLDGTTSGYAIANNSAGEALCTKAFTVSAWVKPAGLGREYMVSCDRDVGTPYPGGFSLRIFPSGSNYYFQGMIQLANDSSKKMVTGVSNLAVGQWYHTAMTFNGTNLALYVNGVLEATTALGGAGLTMQSPPFNLCLGALAYQAPTWYRYNGDLDQVTVINRALSYAEVTAQAQPYRLFTANPIRDTWILPTQLPWDLMPANNGMDVSASAGEYEAATLVVQAANNPTNGLSGLTVTNSDLVCGGNLISATNINIKMVKCWYQGDGDDILYSAVPQLKPELLVNDASWIAADETTQSNIVQNQDWPSDAASLQPVNVGAGRAQQYWMTLRVPSGAVTGDYTGTITVSCAGGPNQTLPLRAHVNSLVLTQSCLAYGLHYTGHLVSGAQPTVVNPSTKTASQYLAEMRDLASHGMTTHPFMYDDMGTSTPDFTLVDQEMQLRQQAGLPFGMGITVPVTSYAYLHGYYLSPPNGWTQASVLADYDSKLAAVLAHFSTNGFPEPLFYGKDEAGGAALTGQIPMYQKIHDKGGRGTVSVYSTFYSQMEAAQTNAGSLIDFPILGVNLDDPNQDAYQTVINNVHSIGHKIWGYGYPHMGAERPYLYRHNYGLWSWAYGLDGTCDFAYQYQFGSSIYDDFGDPQKTYRQHVAAYPTRNGVVDTIQWEGFREGTEDVKYLSALLNLIARCKAGRLSGDPIYDAGVREEGYLTRLKTDLLAGKINENRMNAIRAALLRKAQALSALKP